MKKKTNKKDKIKVSKLVEAIRYNGLGGTLVNGGVRAKDIANKQLARLWKATRKNVKKIQKLLKKESDK